MNVAFTELASNNRHYFLYRALAPLKPFLDDRDVVEISVNRPGQVYVERLGAAHMEFHEIPDLTTAEIVNIGERVAASTNQFVSPANPILSAALPTGERIQIVLPPAAPEGGTRRHILQRANSVIARCSMCYSVSPSGEAGRRAMPTPYLTFVKESLGLPRTACQREKLRDHADPHVARL